MSGDERDGNAGKAAHWESRRGQQRATAWPFTALPGGYELPPDRHPILGPTPGIDGLFLANRCSGHDVMHSPATGRPIAERIPHGETRLMDISPRGIKRFAAGRLL
jgi:sarcosine oxidase subunit beta